MKNISMSVSGWPLVGKIIAGATVFNLANFIPGGEGLILGFAWMVYEIGKSPLARQAFYGGWAAGVLAFAGPLGFFWNIFGAPAVVLWALLGLFVALFALGVWQVRTRLGVLASVLSAPFLWMGWEYFRSELYHLRFAWLTLGSTFADRESIGWIMGAGCYGAGALLMLWGALLAELPLWCRGMAGGFSMASLILVAHLGGAGMGSVSPDKLDVAGTVSSAARVRDLAQKAVAAGPPTDAAPGVCHVGGIQTEGAPEIEMLVALQLAVVHHPQVHLWALSEYAFDGPVPERFRDWARKTGRYLVAGGKEPCGSTFENSVYVVGPDGQIAFRQVKSVPIQFFKDGLPAREHALWRSPWGSLAMPICYDLSYARVGDRLARQGAQGMLVVAMDMLEWGEMAHRLNARMTRVRAAEYRIPILRVASSGISQMVLPGGQTIVQTPVGAEFQMFTATMPRSTPAHRPLDRTLVVPSTVFSWMVLLAGLIPVPARWITAWQAFRKVTGSLTRSVRGWP